MPPRRGAAGTTAGAGAAGAAAAAGADAAVSPCSRFSSATLRDSSATRVAVSFFSVSLDTAASGAEALTAPWLSVSLSGAGAAACLLSCTEACTLPLAWRAGSSVFCVVTPEASCWR